MTRDWIYTSFNGSTLILTSGTPGNSQVALNIFEMLHNVAKNICMLIVYCNKKAFIRTAAAAAKSLQSCPTLCDPIDGSPPGSPVPGILQARTLEWVAISFSNAWKWKVKVKSLSRVRLLATSWTAAYQAPPSVGFSRQEYWSGVPLPSPFIRTVNSKEQKQIFWHDHQNRNIWVCRNQG